MKKDICYGFETFALGYVKREERNRAEPINELKNLMNNEKITDQEAAVNHIRQGRFIVGSVDASGSMSFSANPTVQYTSMDARRECARLARLNPGKLFIFVKLSGAELVPTQKAVSV
jgi:hypothetical protein